MVRLPRGVTAFVRRTLENFDHDGALWEGEGIELVGAWKDGVALPIDDYALLQEVASEMQWNRF